MDIDRIFTAKPVTFFRDHYTPEYPDLATASVPECPAVLHDIVVDSFPGYAPSADRPFYVSNWLTHPLHDEHVHMGYFSLGDSPDNFRKNLEKKGPDWHYAQKLVTYTVNSHGYRTYEWSDIDWSNAIVLLGCSNTFGTGVAQDETIAAYLEKLTGRQVVNLGVPGTNNEQIINNATSVFRFFGNPYAMVVNWTALDRFSFYSDNKHDAGLWTKLEVVDDVPLLDMFKLRNYNRTHMNMTGYYQAQTLRMMCEPRCHYVAISYFASTAKFTCSDAYFHNDSQARDLVHPSHHAHKKCAEFVHKKLLEL